MSEANGHKTLTRAEILGRPVSVKAVEVPALGGQVYVRVLGLRERSRLLMASRTADASDYAALALFLTLCDADGVRLFTDDADLERLNHQDGAHLEALAVAAMEFNGLAGGQQDALKKTSSTTTTPDSPSDSPGTSG